MTKDSPQPDVNEDDREKGVSSSDESKVTADGSDNLPPSWSQVWQLPAVIGCISLFLVGIISMMLTRPESKFDEFIKTAEACVADGKFDEGITLIASLESHINDMSKQQLAGLRAVRADLFYGKQTYEGGESQANYSQLIHDYREAVELGLELNPDRIYKIADSLISLSKIDEAREYFNMLPATDSQRRHGILKRLVEQNLTLPQMDYENTYALLGQLLAEPDLSATDRVWAVAKRVELQIEQGYNREAIDSLLVIMQQLKIEGINDYPELYMLLGRAYYETGEISKATQHLKTARKLMAQSEPHRADVLLLLGHIAQSAGEIDEAFSFYDNIIKEYPGTKAVLPAYMGRAEILGRQERYRDSIDDYTTVVSHLIEQAETGSDRRDIMPEHVTDSLLTWHDLLTEKGNPELAIRFAITAERLYTGRRDVPIRLLSSLASTHYILGENILKAAWKVAQESEKLDDITETDPEVVARRIDAVSKLDARKQFLTSGDYYNRLAASLTQDDPEGAVASLWNAAEAFDKGGDYNHAIECLNEYNLYSANHPRQLKGIYRLGRSYQAMEDYPSAIYQYRTLIDDPEHRTSPEGYLAYVPLAKCYLADPENPDAAEAERLLHLVVDGNLNNNGAGAGLEPDAPEYREALIELGTLYSQAHNYKMHDDIESYYPRAIRYLTEAIARYPDDQRIYHLYNRLAHSYRLSARTITNELNLDPLHPSRKEMTKLRDQYLESAIENYQIAINGYESVNPSRRTTLEQESLKYAYFWKADSLYDLGRFDEAINTYVLLTNRYENQQEALVAQARIIVAYAEQDEFEKAQTAQFLAQRMLENLPDTAFDEGLLSREAWEQWLLWSPVLESQISSASKQ